MSGQTETMNEVVLKTESKSSLDQSNSPPRYQVKDEPRSPLLVQAPPPPSGLDWASAYEAKKLALASASSTSHHNESRSVVKFENLAKADVKIESKDLDENGASVGTPMESKTLKKVPGVIRKDASSDKSPVSSLSNRQSKKIEQLEGRKTSVTKLIKQVTVDKDKGSDNWATEYEARKEVALGRMEAGVTAANVGSLSAFHPGVYGTMDNDAAKIEPISRTANTPDVKPTKPRFPHALCGSDANESSTTISASPKTLIHSRKSFATLLPASNLASLSCKPHTSHPGISPGPEVSPSQSCMDQTPKKAPSMAQLFREVKADAKRSQSDWQAEYESRKRARMEVQRKEQDKIKLAKVADRQTHAPKSNPRESHTPTLQNPPFSEKSKAPSQNPRPSMPSPDMASHPQAQVQTQVRPSVVNYHTPYSRATSVPLNRGMGQSMAVMREGTFSHGRGNGYQGQSYPQDPAYNHGYTRLSGQNGPRPRGHWPPRDRGNCPLGSSYNRSQFRGQKEPQFGRRFHRGYNRPPY